MKRISSQEFGQEKKGLVEKLTSTEATILLAFLVGAISLLDFYSHPNGGVADLVRRDELISIFGSVIKNIGNYGFSASLAMSAVVAKNIFKRIFHSEVAQKIIKHGYLFLAASLFALNPLIENFSGNNQRSGDISLGVLGVGMGILLAELLTYRIRQAKRGGRD